MKKIVCVQCGKTENKTRAELLWRHLGAENYSCPKCNGEASRYRRALARLGKTAALLAAWLLSHTVTTTADGAVYSLPPAPSLSAASYQLILDYEVGGGKNYYEKFLSRPTWPGVASGVTVGVGYDLGYNSHQVILDDWADVRERQRLADCAGVTGAKAKARLADVSDIRIDWPTAKGVFDRVTVARFYALAKATFPHFDDLPADCQGALVSLVFNRGTSMYGDSRREMRAIRDLCADGGDVKKIATQIRAMKRLWPSAQGLLKRRDAEAALVEGSA